MSDFYGINNKKFVIMNLGNVISDAVIPTLLLLYLPDARCQSGWPACEKAHFQSLFAGLHHDSDCSGCQAFGPLPTSHARPR